MFPEFISKIGTTMVQAFLIVTAGFIFVGCWDEFLEDVINSRKLLKRRKRGRKLRKYVCPECGYGTWALDHIFNCKCFNCGNAVETKPVPKFEGSTVYGTTSRKNKLKLIEK